MPDYPPLGSYKPFSQSGHGPLTWGSSGASTVAYHRDVLPDLVAGLRGLPALAAEGMPGRAEARPAVLGCVYVLTSEDVIDALLDVDCCVIIDRQQTRLDAAHRLHAAGRPLSSAYFPGFEDLRLPDADGGTPVIGPYSPFPNPLALGPVRAAGWARSSAHGDRRPLVHVKMLVAGRTWLWEDDFGQEQHHFTPLRTWLGSANWTTFAPSHLEFGLWSDDPDLMAHNLSFLLDMIRFSQPLDSTTAGPEPELVTADWDDEAFREYLHDLGPGGEWEP